LPLTKKQNGKGPAAEHKQPYQYERDNQRGVHLRPFERVPPMNLTFCNG
jgi:hypothetical protein